MIVNHPASEPVQFPFPAGVRSSRPHHRAVDRVAQILEHVARSPEPQGLTEIAAAIGAPVSSAQSLVNGLAAVGYLQEQGRGFSLGLVPYFLATLAGSRPVEQVSHAMLEEVVEQTGYIAVLAVLVGGNVYYVDYAASDPSFEYLAQNKLRRPPLETSAGWVLLAGLPTNDAWDFLAAHDAEAQTRVARFGAEGAAGAGGAGEDAAGGDVLESPVDRFQREYPQLRASGECLAPGVAMNGADGVAVAVKSGEETVAAVSVIASNAEIKADGQKILEVLRAATRRWNT